MTREISQLSRDVHNLTQKRWDGQDRRGGNSTYSGTTINLDQSVLKQYNLWLTWFLIIYTFYIKKFLKSKVEKVNEINFKIFSMKTIDAMILFRSWYSKDPNVRYLNNFMQDKKDWCSSQSGNYTKNTKYLTPDTRQRMTIIQL